jgi:DNA-binding NarL/FixJ family response regulator
LLVADAGVPLAWGAVDGPGLVRLTRRLAEARTIDELERAFATGFGRVVDVPMYGFYTLDREGRGIAHNVGVNVSDIFVARYERAMHLDPLVARSRATGRPVYNRHEMSSAEWEESPIYRLAYSTHVARHVAEMPISTQGTIIGALHFAASDEARDFAPADFRMAEAISDVLGATLARIQASEETDRELEHLRAAVDLAAVAVVLTHPTTPELRLNDTAQALLDGVIDGEARLHQLLSQVAGERRFTRRVEVLLASGAPATLHAQCERLADGGLVAVLELQHDGAQLARRALKTLTPREADVAVLAADGLTDREIAQQLTVSHHTVGQHLKRTYRKLGIDSRVALTRLLARHDPG